MLGAIDRIRKAAKNNADLCAAVMAANGIPTERDDIAYVCLDEPLPYYPKAVTLDPNASGELNARFNGFSGIKDSFSNLDANALALKVAFKALWIWADVFHQNHPANWARIENAHDLLKWDQAWRGDDTLSNQLVFPPKCLNDPNLVFLARLSGTTIEAGCIANLSSDVVGISNVFSRKANDLSLYAEALSVVSAIGNGLPVVGYERGGDLEAACDVGFKAIGPLRLLVR